MSKFKLVNASQPKKKICIIRNTDSFVHQSSENVTIVIYF